MGEEWEAGLAELAGLIVMDRLRDVVAVVELDSVPRD
jgi:hypothetical protein